ncbi:mycothiol system anti-sigma-R factor [Demetria terragena]|uniref:mycothiol system anti-sigma-R factor n=1 Tax=Demetria terragena TaxID=63959 RepID=UPI000365C919|nr:mycothiol system anti-sigma-R factor [Demetria terragena]
MSGEGEDVDCRTVVEQIYAYLDGELEGAEVSRLKSHLEECPPCVTEYERDQLLKRLVQRSCACEQAPTTLRAQIMTQITTVSYTRVEYRADG